MTQVYHSNTMTPEEKDDVVSAKTSKNYTEDSAVAPEHDVCRIPSNDGEEIGRIGEVHVHARKWSLQRIYRTYKALFQFIIWAVWTT